MKHLLGIEHLQKEEIEALIENAVRLKFDRERNLERPLAGETWALMFSKSSTRTRVSFEVGLNELGAKPMFLSANDMQLGRGEPIKDTARVLGRMVHGAIIRTFDQQDVEDFASYDLLKILRGFWGEWFTGRLYELLISRMSRISLLTEKSRRSMLSRTKNIPVKFWPTY